MRQTPQRPPPRRAHHIWWPRLGRASLLLLSPALLAGPCSRAKPAAADSAPKILAEGFHLDKTQAAADLAVLTAAPHPFGSPRQADVATWLEQRLKTLGLATHAAAFTVDTPNPAAMPGSPGAGGPVATTMARSGANIYAATTATASQANCVIAFASHYDSKDLPGVGYLGANDGGSSTAALIQVLGYLQSLGAKSGLDCAVAGWFFDGEEAILPGWSDSVERHPTHLVDHTYGSRHLAGLLQPCPQPASGTGTPLCLPPELGPLGGKSLAAVILLDMVGSPGLRLTQDQISSPTLEIYLAQALEALGQPAVLSDRAARVEDDHEPFAERGVRTVDLIDFEHLSYWHQSGDEASTLDYGSMELAGRVALFIAAKSHG